MPKWNGLTLTTVGKNLQIKCQAGQQLKFTKIKIGDGVYDEGTILADLTELKSVKQTVGITECKVNENNQCQVSCVISNAGLENGYFLTELGLYAEDKDLGEILYAVTTDINPDYLPEDGGSVTLSETFNILINVGNITDVTAVIDVGGWATTGYVNQQVTIHDKDPNAHYDMIGASNIENGVRGFVPAPAAGDPRRCLQADGTWMVPDDTKYTNMEGASTTAAGKGGLVPQPRAGDNQSYLRGDGTWEKPALQFYPLGAIYKSIFPTSPAILFGGVWQQIKDCFILAVGDEYPKAEMTGGEKEHKLTVQEMPSHTHTGTTENAGNHNHGGTTSVAGEHYHGSWGEAYPDPPLGIYAGPGYQGSNGGRDYDNYLYKTTTNGAHSHTLTTGNAGTHSHALKIDSSGEGKPHNNMPPFFTAYVWVRIG